MQRMVSLYMKLINNTYLMKTFLKRLLKLYLVIIQPLLYIYVVSNAHVWGTDPWFGVALVILGMTVVISAFVVAMYMDSVVLIPRLSVEWLPAIGFLIAWDQADKTIMICIPLVAFTISYKKKR